ncbi:MAG: radical SAM protein [Sulfuricella sp.]|nr:radical SAM protein [Sulfuricella sp.]
MKACICTTPIRPVPTEYPPFGSLAVIQSLRKIGEDPQFFNIDYFRYKHDQIVEYFTKNQFDVVGISAVVSTAYAYTKYLSDLIKSVSPKTVVIVGGNLAASAEILLRKCEVDFCVVGDGELVIQNLFKVLYQKPLNYDLLRETKGICFLDERDQFCFTGFGPRPSAEEIEWPDYRILEADGSLPYFISDKIDERFTGYDAPVEPGVTQATIVMTKGCVARCTFCHRWEKGFRARPVNQVMDHIKHLHDRYNTKFIDVSDENFGADRKLAWEIASRLGEMNVVWRVAGVRTRTVTKEALLHWKANGCVSVYFGIESGSEKILKVMEKNATLEENINALKWTTEAGLGTVIQLVLGMPGEDDQTIRETADFLKNVSQYVLWWGDKAPSELISINYAQALPGTPFYEFAREHGYIGQGVDEEEDYLIKISDTDAYKEDHFLNCTGLPLLKVLMWRPFILAEVDAYHLTSQLPNPHLSLGYLIQYYLKLLRVRVEKGWGGNSWVASLMKVVLPKARPDDRLMKKENDTSDYYSDSGYFNIHKGFKFAPLLLNPITRKLFYPILAVAMAIKSGSFWQAAKLLAEHIVWSMGYRPGKSVDIPDKSLRKIVTIKPVKPNAEHRDQMLPLRSGR